MNKNTYNSKPITTNAETLFHLVINNGVSTTKKQSFLSPYEYLVLKPLLHYRVGSIPKLPDFTASWHSSEDTHLFTIAKFGVPVVLGALALGPNGAEALWDNLLNHREPSACEVPAPDMPVETPWLAVLMLPEFFELKPHEPGFLGFYSSKLGLAIQRYHLESN